MQLNCIKIASWLVIKNAENPGLSRFEKKVVTKCSTWPTKAQAQAWAAQTEIEILSKDDKPSLLDKTLLEWKKTCA